MYIDFSNAFGSADHDKLQLTLRHLCIPEQALRVIRNIYPGSDPKGSPMQIQVALPQGSTDAFQVRRGNIQGDSLSPLLFLLYIEPLLRWLEAGSRGFKHTAITTHEVRTSAAAYADDLAITTNNVQDLLKQTEKLQLFTYWAGLRVNPTKCAVTGYMPNQSKHNRITKNTYAKVQYRTQEGLTPIPYLDPSQPYTYLGVEITATLAWKHHRKKD